MELIGLKARTGRPVGGRMDLMLFDEQLHAAAVGRLVQKARRGALEIGDHKPDRGSQAVMFGHKDDPPRRPPGAGLITKRAKQLHRLSQNLRLMPRFFHYRSGLLNHRLIGHKSQNIFEISRLTELHHLRRLAPQVFKKQSLFGMILPGCFAPFGFCSNRF